MNSVLFTIGLIILFILLLPFVLVSLRVSFEFILETAEQIGEFLIDLLDEVRRLARGR